MRKSLMSAVLAAVFLSAGSMASATSANVLFLMDGSGSMAQKIGGTPKIVIAKQTFAQVLGKLPASLNAGLIAYGHVGEKDCSAIREMVPISRLDPAALQLAVAGISPDKGATPIAAALRRAAEKLKGRQGSNTIVLITDGEETCGGDPVAAVRELRASGIDVRVHVVGFDVNDKARKQLMAIAQAGGGRYFDARDAAGLQDSLAQVRQEIVKVAETPRQTVFFRDDFDGEALQEHWQVFKKDDEVALVADGYYNVISQPGLKNSALLNVQLPKNYQITLRLTTEIKNLATWRTQRVGMSLFEADKDDFAEFTNGKNGLFLEIGSIDTWKVIRLAFRKKFRGKFVPASVIEPYKGTTEERPYFLRIEKKGFNYTAYFSPDGRKWRKVGVHRFLGKKFKVGIYATRHKDARESLTKFDWIEIRELP